MPHRHVDEQLSGFLDGELTQQQRQRVRLHCEECAECRHKLDDLRVLRERVGRACLSDMGEDEWRETMNDITVRTSRSIGWLLFVAGLLAASGVGLYHFVADAGTPAWVKIILVCVYGGLAILLFSVLRQRLIERKTDRYKDVEI